MSKKDNNIDKQVEDIEQQDKKPVVPKTAQIQQIKDFIDKSYDVRFNSVTQTLEYREKNTIGYEQLTDQIKTDIIIQLKQLFFEKPKEDLDDLLNSSMIPRYDPMKEYFNTIPYNGDGFIARLANCIVLDEPDKIIDGQRFQDLFRSYFEKWLIACYRCCIGKLVNDVMFILIGPQGLYKTTFLNYLTPSSMEDYRVCSHLTTSLSDYNTSNFLAEKMFINVDDQMETIFGKDYNSMKAIISAPDITNRKLYRATHQRRKRIANFCGTVNESRFLRDSNNRRYLCFAVADIKQGYKNIDMDDVWAEVKRKSDQINSMYIFGRDDYRIIDLMNTSYEAPTVESEMLHSVFKPEDESDRSPVFYMQFSEILHFLKVESGDNSLKIFNLQTAMRKFGFRTRSVKVSRFGKSPRYLYPVQLINQTEDLCSRLFQYRKE